MGCRMEVSGAKRDGVIKFESPTHFAIWSWEISRHRKGKWLVAEFVTSCDGDGKREGATECIWQDLLPSLWDALAIVEERQNVA